MASVAQLTSPIEGISCHAWSPDGSELAVCPNSNELHIYKGTDNPDKSKWTKAHLFTEHDLLISAVDWCPITNKIVTCSHDRNAFVWTQQTGATTPGGLPTDIGVWKPSLTLLRIDRAALDVKWSPDGKKFAVASGAKCVPVCHYESEHDWWVSKMIKKHKSTVLSVAWHPNSQILATGGCDFRCRIFSAYIEAVDGVDGATQQVGPFMEGQGFGNVYTEFTCRSWVHSVAWCPSGRTLAYAGHDSTVHIVSFPRPGVGPFESIITLQGLPVNVLSFVSEKAIIAGGHDFNPFIITGTATGGWNFMQYLDQKAGPGEAGGKSASAGSSNVQAARALFQSKTTKGQEGKKEGDDLWTKHEAPIISLQALPKAKTSKGITAFSTAAMDGRIITWDLPSLNIAMASLGLS